MIFDNAKRPLLIYGWGIHLANAESEAREFARNSGIPVISTWAAADLFRHDNELYCGTFGTHGTRAANFALQNADVVLSVGSRLDTKATGSPASDFARKAKVYMVDIDQTEIDKFKRLGREVNGICMDAKKYLRNMLDGESLGIVKTPSAQTEWIAKIAEWKAKYPIVLPEYPENSPYRFVEKLSDLLLPSDTIVSDTGCPVGWMATAFKFTGQRFYHAWNSTPMGYGLPASIGAAFASRERVICITGDGGLGVNVTELATVAKHDLNIKIILFNNRGHAMCRQTQRTWLGGTYPSTSAEGGLATPDYEEIARAYEIPVSPDIEHLLLCDGPGFYQFNVDIDEQVNPQVKFGYALDNAHPLLPPYEVA